MPDDFVIESGVPIPKIRYAKPGKSRMTKLSPILDAMKSGESILLGWTYTDAYYSLQKTIRKRNRSYLLVRRNVREFHTFRVWKLEVNDIEHNL